MDEVKEKGGIERGRTLSGWRRRRDEEKEERRRVESEELENGRR